MVLFQNLGAVDKPVIVVSDYQKKHGAFCVLFFLVHCTCKYGSLQGLLKESTTAQKVCSSVKALESTLREQKFPTRTLVSENEFSFLYCGRLTWEFSDCQRVERPPKWRAHLHPFQVDRDVLFVHGIPFQQFTNCHTKNWSQPSFTRRTYDVNRMNGAIDKGASTVATALLLTLLATTRPIAWPSYARSVKTTVNFQNWLQVAPKPMQKYTTTENTRLVTAVAGISIKVLARKYWDGP